MYERQTQRQLDRVPVLDRQVKTQAATIDHLRKQISNLERGKERFKKREIGERRRHEGIVAQLDRRVRDLEAQLKSQRNSIFSGRPHADGIGAEVWK